MAVIPAGAHVRKFLSAGHLLMRMKSAANAGQDS
jgi:hypothetical protein